MSVSLDEARVITTTTPAVLDDSPMRISVPPSLLNLALVRRVAAAQPVGARALVPT